MSEEHDYLRHSSAVLLKAFDRFLEKQADGFYGWDDPNYRNNLIVGLQEAFFNRKWIDVINFAIFLWALDKKNEVSSNN